MRFQLKLPFSLQLILSKSCHLSRINDSTSDTSEAVRIQIYSQPSLTHQSKLFACRTNTRRSSRGTTNVSDYLRRSRVPLPRRYITYRVIDATQMIGFYIRRFARMPEIISYSFVGDERVYRIFESSSQAANVRGSHIFIGSLTHFVALRSLQNNLGYRHQRIHLGTTAEGTSRANGNDRQGLSPGQMQS